MKNDRAIARRLAGISERNVQDRLAKMEGKLTNLTFKLNEITSHTAKALVQMKALQSELASVTLETEDDE